MVVIVSLTHSLTVSLTCPVSACSVRGVRNRGSVKEPVHLAVTLSTSWVIVVLLPVAVVAEVVTAAVVGGALAVAAAAVVVADCDRWRG